MNYYIKVNIAERGEDPFAYFAIKDYDKGKRAPLIARHFPLDLISEHEPRLMEFVAGDIDNVYLEIKKGYTVNQISEDGLPVNELSEEDVKFLIELTKTVCLEEKYDELLAPPSVDQQVEDFIKEFFETDEDNLSELNNLDDEKPLDQKDFLAEFFAELEEDSDEAEK
jgi:hypothetical protein